MKGFLTLIVVLLALTPSYVYSTAYELLREAKKALDSGSFQRAKDSLSKAYVEFKEIGDYILLWRAKANFGLENYEEAHSDLNQIKKNFPKSPIIREARKLELEILKKLKATEMRNAYRNYLVDYPDDIVVKFEYASFLKEQGNHEEAKRLFREIFISPSVYGDRAERELSKEDLTVDDLHRRARALNSAYQFAKAEKYLREALSRAPRSQHGEILESLGYCLFMQKRYSESAEVFRRVGDPYWRGRSLLRSRDFASFERELGDYVKSGDSRIGELLINYANIKRRSGNLKEAESILRNVLEKYPNYREEALWYLGWSYYLAAKYSEASQIFQKLYSTYGKLKYYYWAERSEEAKGIKKARESAVPFRQGELYSYLLYMKGKVSQIPEPVTLKEDAKLPRRVEILIQADLRDEALREVKATFKNLRDENHIPLYSQILNSLGDYPTSVRAIAKSQRRKDYQELLYPKAYREIVERASKRFSVEPALVYAVMREESRFDREAVSPAGALGLMQLMPSTGRREAQRIGISIKSDSELFDPEKNIFIGTAHLRGLLNEFENLAFAVAAYNAGERVVKAWISDGKYRSIDEFIEDIPFSETRGYVQRVLSSYLEYLRGERRISADRISQILSLTGGLR